MSSPPPSLNLIKQKFFVFFLFFSLPIFHELPECKFICPLVFFSGVTNFKSQNERDMKKIMIIIIHFFLLWNVCWMREMKRFDVRVVPCFHPVLISLALGYFRLSPFLHHNFSLIAILFSLLLWLQLKFPISSLPILIQLEYLRVESCRRKKLTKQKHHVAGRTYVQDKKQ